MPPGAAHPGQVRDRLVARRTTQRVHRLLDPAVQLPPVGVLDLLHEVSLLGEQGVEVSVRFAHCDRHFLESRHRRSKIRDRILDVLPDRLRLVQRRFLLQEAHRVPRRQLRVPVRRLIEPGHDPKNRRLAGTIGPDYTDLGAWQERQGDIVQDQLVADSLTDLAHGVDELSHFPALCAVGIALFSGDSCQSTGTL